MSQDQKAAARRLTESLARRANSDNVNTYGEAQQHQAAAISDWAWATVSSSVSQEFSDYGPAVSCGD